LSWANRAIEKLQSGEVVEIENEVSVIKGRLKYGHIVTLESLNSHLPDQGEIVLVRFNGKDFFRLVEEVGKKKVLVGDSSGYTGGWVRKKDIFGIVKKIEKK